MLKCCCAACVAEAEDHIGVVIGHSGEIVFSRAYGWNGSFLQERCDAHESDAEEDSHWNYEARGLHAWHSACRNTFLAISSSRMSF